MAVNPDHVDLAAIAQELIAENGRQITLTKFDKDPADSSMPWRGTASGEERSNGTSMVLTAVSVEPESSEEFGLNLSKQELETIVDKVYLVAANSITSGERIEDYEELTDSADTRQMMVYEIRGLIPGEVAMIYFILTRQ